MGTISVGTEEGEKLRNSNGEDESGMKLLNLLQNGV